MNTLGATLASVDAAALGLAHDHLGVLTSMASTASSTSFNAASIQRLPVSSIWAPQDYDSPDFTAAERAGEVRRLGRNAYRAFLSITGGSGTSDVMWLGDGHAVNVINLRSAVPQRQLYLTDEPLIMLRASLACDVSYAAAGAAALLFRRPEVTLVHVPAGMQLEIDVVAGARQQGLVGFYRATVFASHYGLRPDDLPPLLRAAVLGEGTTGRIASFPIDERIAALVAETIDSPLSGELRQVQCAARMAELVAFTIDAMQRTPALHGGGVARRRNVDFAQAARARLEREYRDPPRFAELAHELGTNQNKLKTAFRELFGMTMADYCLECRMREAQQLLLEDRLSIAQIAESVGYEHQSSFTAAFRSHVGMLPSEYRKHRAAFSLPLGKPPTIVPA